MDKPNQIIIDAFEEAFTVKKHRLKRWLVVADRYLKFYGNDKFERHWTAEDILNEVITKVLTGERNYNPEKYKGVDDYIFKTIRSIVDNEVGNRRLVCPAEDYGGDDEDGSPELVNVIEQVHATEKEQIHKNYIINEKLESSYQKLLEDEEAALVFLDWQKGLKSNEIAESLGIELEEVELAKKRIRYKLNNGKRAK